ARLCTSPGPKGVVRVLSAAKLGGRWRSPYGCLQIPVSQRGVRLDSAKLIRQVQAMGMQVHFWTINDADEMNRLLDRGADAIITDEIELLKDVLESRGHSV
ncbi:MAG: glycerophosphodiester phosphodiesterase family protein, partial [Acidimicrobiales bacterium]